VQSYIRLGVQEGATLLTVGEGRPEGLDRGRFVINGAPHEPLAPFGGFKQSGIDREYGHFGLEALLEPCAVLAS